MSRTRPPCGRWLARFTTVDRTTLDQLLVKLTTVPDGFNVHPKLTRWLEQRAGALERNAVDWAVRRGLRLSGIGLMLSSRPVGRFEGYVTSGADALY